MRTTLFWEAFAEAIIKRCIRPEPGDPFLIITDTGNDLGVAEACLAAAIRAGADAQLIVKERPTRDTPTELGPVISNAILGSKFVLTFSDGIEETPAILEARSKGMRLLLTDPTGIEDYVVRALLDVDIDAMVHNGEFVVKLWNETELCQVISPQGTDVSFQLKPRKALHDDGILTREGELDFFPGAQVSIAPVEESINGTIVVDASDHVQGVVHSPYTLTLEKGVITSVEGGKEADMVREWLESRDDLVYRLCHFSVGLNPQAGISGNLIEDERKVAAVDFGFGYQDPDLGGSLGMGSYHWDVMLATPTIILDGKEMSGGSKLNPEMGFETV
ncbi:MAG: hypothetical protein ACC652_07305 [Acidimicrobiales bacterium]